MATQQRSTVRQPSTRIQQHRRYLMCAPKFFDVVYSVNPWMDPSRPTDAGLALRQWQTLHDTYISLGHDVELVEPEPGLPDMVFTANAGLVIDGVAYGASFRYPERAGEVPWFDAWFRSRGFEVVHLSETFEGEGDSRLVGDVILAGMGFRSSAASHRELAAATGREVVSLRLVDPRFYHLDTALAVLDPVQGPGGVEKANIAYLPDAFDDAGRGLLAERFPDAILIDAADGDVLGANVISDGLNVVVSPRAAGFQDQLRGRGYNVVTVDMSELLKSGGGIKCCTLELRGRK